MLIHFSSSKDVVQVTSTKQSNDMSTLPRAAPGKPRGFWVSVEGNGDGWSSWCRSEHFRTGSLRYRYEIKLADDANILYLRSAEDIDRFTLKYTDHDNPVNKIIREVDEDLIAKEGFRFAGKSRDSMYIDWEKVEAEGYQGIIIAPYIWSRRLDGPMWYYGWDCASGCIWDNKAIKSIEQFKGRVPKEKSYEATNTKS